MKSSPPSGPWRGYYLHPTMDDERHPMDLTLSFTDGRISGGGDDDVGAFSIKGSFDAASGEATWIKSYASHKVYYRGFYEAGAIWGVWQLYSGSTGGFKIWPKGSGGEASRKAEVEESVSDPVPVGSDASRRHTVKTGSP